jgi:hypothetical protein
MLRDPIAEMGELLPDRLYMGMLCDSIAEFPEA